MGKRASLTSRGVRTIVVAVLASFCLVLLSNSLTAPVASEAAAASVEPLNNAEPAAKLTPSASMMNVAPVATALFVPSVAATKVDSLFTDVDGDTKADPGDTLQYTVTIGVSGMDATGVVLTDTIDPNTTLVPGSVNTSPVAVNDAYAALGNVSISVPAPSGLLANDFDLDGNAISINGILPDRAWVVLLASPLRRP